MKMDYCFRKAAAVIGTMVALGVMPVWAQIPKLASKQYGTARHLLVKSGLKPVALKHNENEEFFCADNFCKLYPEVLNCTGTGVNPCMFVYFSKQKKTYLIVDTHGETRLTVTGAHWASSYEIKDIQRNK